MPAIATPVQIVVSHDRLHAHIAADLRHAPSLEDIVARVVALGITLDEDVRRRAGQFASELASGKAPASPFLLAEGRAPVSRVPARFIPAATATETPAEGTRVELYQTHITMVKAGDRIGTLSPAQAGRPGVDVFGARVQPDESEPDISVGENVTLSDDGTTLTAVIAGKVHVAHNAVSVLDVVPVQTDVDITTGNIDAPSNILISGTVREGFNVKSAKSITVRGAVEASAVEAVTDVHIHGGVAARGLGKIVAGGDILARFCDGANLRAGGDVIITSESMNSTIYACKRIEISKALVGGQTYARAGMQVRELGNDANVPTRIAIGPDPDVLLESAETDKRIKKKLEAAAAIREKVQPLMSMLKRLTAQQREQATELMYQADSMEAEAKALEAEKAATLAATRPEGTAILVVTGIIYPNVTIICGDKMATFVKQRRGYVKIFRKLQERVEEIISVDQVSGGISVLVSVPYVRSTPAADRPRT